jgi:titin
MYSLDPSFITNVQSVSINGTAASIQDANLVIPYADRITSTGWFYFKVCAVNSVGAGPYTSAVTLVADALPNAVTNLAASNLNADGDHAPSTITLSWNYDIDNSTPLLGYIVAYLDTSGEMTSVYVNDVSNAPSYTIAELQNGNSYDFSVFGINMLGAGPSLDVSAVPSTVPDAPVVTIGHGDQSIQLSWFEPYDEGNAVTGYRVYRSTDGNGYTQIAEFDESVLSYEDTGLTNGTTYYYRVAAVNDNGEGIWSDVQSEYPSTVPNAPTISCLENSNSQGNGQQLTVRWHQNPTDVCKNGGSTIIQFDIRDGDNNLLGSVMASNGTSHYSYVINNLINGQSYSFNVSAENRDGEGSSASSTSEIPSGLPDAPSGLIVENVNALNDGHQALISVDALNVASGGINISPSDEGSEFDHFVVYRDGNPVGTMTDTFTDTGLANGQSYSYTVSAVNDNGEGAQCFPVTFVASCKPDAVSGLSAVHGNHQVQLSWNLLAVAPSESPSD